MKTLLPDSLKTPITYTLIFAIMVLQMGCSTYFKVRLSDLFNFCPHVYAHEGKKFVFEGEAFGGAIGHPLKRDDYIPLPSLKPQNNIYRIRIANELQQKQYIDLAQLVVVDHPKDKTVLLDKYGKPHLIGNTTSPTKATSFDGRSLSSVLAKKDKRYFAFDAHDYSKNGVIMKFARPANTSQCKLILNAKNTLWSDHVSGEVFKKFGSYFNTWMNRTAEVSYAKRIQRYRNTGLPLSIYIKKNGTWQFIDDLNTIGSLATRNFVVPIDLSLVPGEEIEVKVTTGFKFWELDYIGVDFTKNGEIHTTYQKPIRTNGTGSADGNIFLKEKDGKYLSQEKNGDLTDIQYYAPPVRNGQAQTTFLHIHGYYKLVRDYKGVPKFAQLLKFNDPGHFSDFSRSMYLEQLNSGGE